MLTRADASEIIRTVQMRLNEAATVGGAHSRVEAKESRLEDEWLYVCVSPTQPGERASDHAELMARIEKELRDEGIENVLLVPTVGD